jgi:hypothetical protein
MKPTDFIDRRHVQPTIPEMARVALLAGVDRISMVREATDTRNAGICIVMIGNQAIREIGPYLNKHLATLPAPPEPKRELFVDNNIPIPKLFWAMEQNNWQWCYDEFSIEQTKCVVTVIIGPSVTVKLAQELTRLGCITNLK